MAINYSAFVDVPWLILPVPVIRQVPGSHSISRMSFLEQMSLKMENKWTSLVAQWIRIHLPLQETWVRSLVQEDPTGCRATKPMCHSSILA